MLEKVERKIPIIAYQAMFWLAIVVFFKAIYDEEYAYLFLILVYGALFLGMVMGVRMCAFVLGVVAIVSSVLWMKWMLLIVLKYNIILIVIAFFPSVFCAHAAAYFWFDKKLCAGFEKNSS